MDNDEWAFFDGRDGEEWEGFDELFEHFTRTRRRQARERANRQGNTWRTADGREMKISELSNQHLANIVRKLIGEVQKQLKEEGIAPTMETIDAVLMQAAIPWPALKRVLVERAVEHYDNLKQGAKP